MDDVTPSLMGAILDRCEQECTECDGTGRGLADRLGEREAADFAAKWGTVADNEDGSCGACGGESRTLTDEGRALIEFVQRWISTP